MATKKQVSTAGLPDRYYLRLYNAIREGIGNGKAHPATMAVRVHHAVLEELKRPNTKRRVKANG